MQKPFYSADTLRIIARDRGYMTDRAIADGLAPIFRISRNRLMLKIRYGIFTKEECEVIGSFFQMTPKEYFGCFMNGLFIEDWHGKFHCHIEEPYVHMHSNYETLKTKRKKRKRAKERQDLIDSIDKL